MALPLIIAAAAGAAVSAYSQYQSARAQADAQQNQAQLDRARSLEVIERNRINNDLLERSSRQVQGTQLAQAAASGFSLDLGIMQILEETARLSEEEQLRNLRVAKWEATMINSGAEARERGADQLRTAGTISAIGTALAGAADIAKASPGGFKKINTTQPQFSEPGISAIGSRTRG